MILDWESATANVERTDKLTLPTGSNYEFIVEAYLASGTVEESDRAVIVRPTEFFIEADGEKVRVLDSAARIRQELYSNGYVGNEYIGNASRICFAPNCSDSDHQFQGAFNCGNVSSLSATIKFPSNCHYRIVSKKYSKVRIQTNGVIRTSFE